MYGILILGKRTLCSLQNVFSCQKCMYEGL